MKDFTNKQPVEEKKKQKELFGQLMRYSAVGIEMGVAVGIGVVVGSYLDRRFDTEPWLLLTFLGLGIAAGFKAFFRLVKQLSPSRKDNQRSSPG